MNIRRILLGLGLTSLCFFDLAVPAYSDQPQTVAWQLAKLKRDGRFKPGSQPMGDHLVNVRLFAGSQDLSRTSLLVVFPGCSYDPPTLGRPVLNLDEVIAGQGRVSPIYDSRWEDPGPRWRVCPNKNELLIRPGKRVPVQLMVDFLRPVDEGLSPRIIGKVYEVSDELLRDGRGAARAGARKAAAGGGDPLQRMAAVLKDQMPLGDFVIDLYYRTESKNLTFQLGDYAQVFGRGEAPEQPEVEKVTGDYDALAQLLPVNVGSYRRTMPIPGDTEDDQGALLRQTLEQVKSRGSGLAGEEVCEEDDEYSDPKPSLKTARQVGSAYFVSGKFSTKWSIDHTLHPGFGFRVEAWTDQGGSWKKLASDWVQSNGTWQLSIGASADFNGDLLRVLYRSYNSYYKPQNQDGNTYSWRDPDWLFIPTNFYVGHRYADTDGGDYNGVGELVDAAMVMWSRLYWVGGINPVPSEPLSVFFPNTWENCSGTGPWSCANVNGNIWLIADHGRDARVVVHEFAHQLNNKYWDKKRPAGSGGSHTLTGCYPTRLGMALREGFANFMPGWVGYPGRNVANGGFNSDRWSLGYDLERQVSPPNCANGWENEVWVARAFWDLHDTRADGDDILWFNHLGAVPLIYLNNGIASDGDARDMRFYENVYRNAASPGHQGFISDIFEQNRQ